MEEEEGGEDRKCSNMQKHTMKSKYFRLEDSRCKAFEHLENQQGRMDLSKGVSNIYKWYNMEYCQINVFVCCRYNDTLYTEM